MSTLSVRRLCLVALSIVFVTFVAFVSIGIFRMRAPFLWLWAAPYLIEKLTGLGLPKTLAFLIGSSETILALGLIGYTFRHALFNLNAADRKRASQIAIVLTILFTLGHGYFVTHVTADHYFDRWGNPVKYYTEDQVTGRITIFDAEIYDPYIGKQAKPVTPQIAQRLLDQENGQLIEVPLNQIKRFFDEGGRPIVYYSRHPDNNLHFYRHLGICPVTGVQLEPVTAEIVKLALNPTPTVAETKTIVIPIASKKVSTPGNVGGITNSQTIFFEDFSSVEPGRLPRHWKGGQDLQVEENRHGQRYLMRTGNMEQVSVDIPNIVAPRNFELRCIYYSSYWQHPIISVGGTTVELHHVYNGSSRIIINGTRYERDVGIGNPDWNMNDLRIRRQSGLLIISMNGLELMRTRNIASNETGPLKVTVQDGAVYAITIDKLDN